MAESPTKKKSAKPPTDDTAPSTLSISDIKELFVLMRDNEIAELRLEQQETKIHIVSKGAHLAAPQMVPMMHGMSPMGMVPVGAQAQPTANPAPAVPSAPATEPGAIAPTADALPSNIKTVFSPMVGTFYAAPAPDAPPFVKVGESVTDETVLCIIEAMKLMNEIKAETKGRIYKMLVESGNPVEYNQPLFLIEP